MKPACLSALAVAYLLIAGGWRPAIAQESLYTAEMADGQRVAGGHLTDWGNGNQPKLNGRPLFDPANPIRWLKRETTDQPAQPTAYLEMVGGDVLPGRTIELGPSSTPQTGELGSFLIVEPTTPVNQPDGPPRATVRVLTRWLRRVVWRRRSHGQFEPSTLFFSDGRQLAFRSIRFRGDSVSVLTEGGRVDVPFADLAELDMPRMDWWDAYFEQVALLTPDCSHRLMRLQTLDGLRATVSPDRVEVVSLGDQNNSELWYHAAQPAWSLDPLYLRHARISMRQFFAPQEVPLSFVEPTQIRLRSTLAVGWPPRVDRNVQGGLLISGGKEFGWGWGTQAYTELEFPLPACAVSFRSTVGLDKVVGKGGCARAIVYAQNTEGQPLFRSDHLIGSDAVVDTGVVPLNVAASNPRLVIVSNPDSSDRPAGADPLDIRDVVDWLEPQLNLDLEKLRADVRKRLPGLLPGLDGWTIADGAEGRMVFANRWDTNTRSFHLEFRPTSGAITLKRSLRIEPDQNWLMLYVSRNLDGKVASPTQAVVHIDGQQADNFDVPARWGPETGPKLMPVDKFHDRQVALEVRLESRGDKSFVDWRNLAIVDRWPTLFEVFEDQVQRPIKLTAADGAAAVVATDRYSGRACIKVAGHDARGVLSNLILPIRGNPQFGEYRYIRFAWRKKGGQRIGLDLDYVVNDSGNGYEAARWRRIDRLKEIAKLPAEIHKAETDLQKWEKQTTVYVHARGDEKLRILARLKKLQESMRAEQNAIDQELTGAAVAGTHTRIRYYAGSDPALLIDVRGVKVADAAPEQWTVVTRDLCEQCKDGQLTGITLVCPDGDYALLDHVYLGRTLEDFDHCPPQAKPLSIGKR